MDDDLAFGSEHEPRSNRKAILPHGKTVMFHCLFRFSAILFYFFGSVFSASFVTIFIFVLLLLSADFWTVKNISGRLLVGLRWWNQVDEEGQSKWIFESRSQKSLGRNPINSKESTIFWATLFICPIIWVLFLISSFVTFGWKWLPLIIIALTLNGANLLGYLRCKFSGTQQISKMANDYMAASMLRKVINVIPGMGSKTDQQPAAGDASF